MSEIIVIKTQEELDAVPADWRRYIEIRGEDGQEFALNRLLNSEVHAYGKLCVTLRGGARLYAHDECSVWVYEDSYVCAHDKCTVRCYDRSRNMLTCTATAYMYDRSQAYGVDSSTVHCFDHSRAVSYSHCSLFAHDYSTVSVTDFDGSVLANGFSRVRGSNAKNIELREHSRGNVENGSRVSCHDWAMVTAQNSWVVLCGHSRGVLMGFNECIRRDDAVWTAAIE